MSQPSLLDFDALLAPISEDSPCGSSKDSGENRELVNAFSELRDLTQIARRIEAKRTETATLTPSERASFLADYEGKSDGPEADPKWSRVAELAIRILSTWSKDTRVMLSLAEAMPRVGGMPGLRDAMKACNLLLDRYQLSLFPLQEEGETPDYCLQFLGQMANSKNIESMIDQAEVFPGADHLTWFQHISARNLEKRSEEERTKLIQDGVITLEDFNKELIHANTTDLNRSLQEIVESIAEAQSLDRMFTQLSDKKRPLGISPVIERLQQLRNWFKTLAADRLQTFEADSPQESNATATAGSEGHFSTPATAGSLSSREQALGSLLQVAAYFRKAEPHSPLSYSLEQAVRWGKMPLPELLRDLVKDANVLSDVYTRMGIQAPSSDTRTLDS